VAGEITIRQPQVSPQELHGKISPQSVESSLGTYRGAARENETGDRCFSPHWGLNLCKVGVRTKNSVQTELVEFTPPSL
jgi:hypothetical protein